VIATCTVCGQTARLIDRRACLCLSCLLELRKAELAARETAKREEDMRRWRATSRSRLRAKARKRRWRKRQRLLRMPQYSHPIARALAFCRQNFGPREYRSCLHESSWVAMGGPGVGWDGYL